MRLVRRLRMFFFSFFIDKVSSGGSLDRPKAYGQPFPDGSDGEAHLIVSLWNSSF
jgi:hypothetical protein